MVYAHPSMRFAHEIWNYSNRLKPKIVLVQNILNELNLSFFRLSEWQRKKRDELPYFWNCLDKVAWKRSSLKVDRWEVQNIYKIDIDTFSESYCCYILHLFSSSHSFVILLNTKNLNLNIIRFIETISFLCGFFPFLSVLFLLYLSMKLKSTCDSCVRVCVYVCSLRACSIFQSPWFNAKRLSLGFSICRKEDDGRQRSKEKKSGK